VGGSVERGDVGKGHKNLRRMPSHWHTNEVTRFEEDGRGGRQAPQRVADLKVIKVTLQLQVGREGSLVRYPGGHVGRMDGGQKGDLQKERLIKCREPDP